MGKLEIFQSLLWAIIYKNPSNSFYVIIAESKKKKWKIGNFADFRPFFNELVLYNAIPKYSIWFCLHFGTKILKVEWKIRSQWSFKKY